MAHRVAHRTRNGGFGTNRKFTVAANLGSVQGAKYGQGGQDVSWCFASFLDTPLFGFLRHLRVGVSSSKTKHQVTCLFPQYFLSRHLLMEPTVVLIKYCIPTSSRPVLAPDFSVPRVGAILWKSHPEGNGP